MTHLYGACKWFRILRLLLQQISKQLLADFSLKFAQKYRNSLNSLKELIFTAIKHNSNRSKLLDIKKAVDAI